MSDHHTTRRRSARALFAGVLFLVAGCAAPTALLKPSYRYTGPTVMLQGTEYMPLKVFCDALRYDCGWDRFRQVATVRGDEKELTCLVGSSAILLNSQPAVLTSPVRWYDGAVMVPRTLEDFFITHRPRPDTVRLLRRHPIRHVIIDPGHGGKDPGAIGVGGVREKQVVLDISQQVARQLQGAGYTVSMTRANDTFIPLPDRGGLANTRRATFFIAIHANANRNPRVQGVEVYYLTPKSLQTELERATRQAREAALPVESSAFDGSPEVKTVVWDLLNVERRRQSMELARVIAARVAHGLNVRNGGVKGARFQVLRDANMPAVLVEVGYLTHPTEGARLADPAHRQRLASAITTGITDYFCEYERQDAFTQ